MVMRIKTENCASRLRAQCVGVNVPNDGDHGVRLPCIQRPVAASIQEKPDAVFRGSLGQFATQHFIDFDQAGVRSMAAVFATGC